MKGGTAPTRLRLGGDTRKRFLFPVEFLKGSDHRAPQLRGALGDVDAGCFEGLELLRRRTLATRDDGAGMSHALPRRCGRTGDEPDDRLAHACPDELRGILFGRTADLANHDDTLGGRIFLEHLENIDEAGTRDRVTADPDARRLPETELGELVHGLISERAATRYDADGAGLVDVAGHDADLALTRRDDAGTIRAYEARSRACVEVPLHTHHVEYGNSLGNADNQRHAGIGGFHDRIGGKRWRDVDDRCIGTGGSHGLCHRVKDGDPLEVGAALPGRNARHHLSTVFLAGSGVELSRRAGDSLRDNAGVFVDQNAQCRVLGDGKVARRGNGEV